jgi:ATP/maltotriose-dependent transcriptional regulator MalT
VVISGHLVGRVEELGSIDAVLDGLERGEPAALAVLGEPGIGKTRLLAEVGVRADDRGCLVLTGSAPELESDLPFWVFVDALDEYVRSLPPSILDALGGEARMRLGQALPSLSGDSTDGSTSPQDRYRIHRSVRELLEALAAAKPLVLVLDDLHWADPASVELVGALLHQPPAAPVAIALGVRPRQVPGRLTASFERASRAGTLVRLELDALTLGEARELLGEEVADVAVLHDESGGNPFYLEQLARSVGRASTPAADTVALVSLDVPRSVADALSAELAGLSRDARLVLEGAAVAGDPFEPELAASVAGTSEIGALEALDELLRLDLVRPTDVPRRFRFRHPLVRRAVYESAPGGWRLTAHERAAGALAERGASAEARAHHVDRSARTGDLDAVALLRTAADETAYRAPASAARWLEAALRLLPETAPATERVELLLELWSALTSTGRFEESHAALVDALALVPEEERALRVRLTAACASAERVLRRYGDAHARLARALDDLGDRRSAEAVVLMVELSLDSRHRTEYDEMSSWAAQALDAARALGDEPLTVVATALLANADAFAGATAEAETHLRDATALVDAMRDEALAPRLDALGNVATAELYIDRFRESCAHSERAIAIAYVTGQTARIPYLAPALGSARVYLGDLAEAAEVLDDAIDATRLSQDLQGLAWNLFNRSAAALAAGDLDTALATGRESLELTQDFGPSLIAVRAAVVWAAALVENGDAERAIEALVDSSGGEDLAFLPGAWRTKRLELLTRGYLATERADDAARAAAEAEECARASGLRLAEAMAQRAVAAVALHTGDAERAAERALASAAAADVVRAPIEAALSRILAGRALARAGRTEEAAAELDRAVSELEPRGAVRYRDEAAHELRKLGRTVYRRSAPGTADDGLASLTERELELARLVVDRKTNPQIAAELFLSQKTVETHLRNIFRKVGVSNRVELAHAVELAARNADTPT